MPKVALPIAKGFFKSGSKPVADRVCINVYPVIEQRRALVQESLRGSPGVALIAADATSG
jgi:hypothetical protein